MKRNVWKEIACVISVKLYLKVTLSHPIFFSKSARCDFMKIVVILNVAPTAEQ